jgi:SAM-dependent methyltransferase
MSGDNADTDPRDVKFDEYAASYAALHQQSIAASGESTAYFTDYKLGCIERWLEPTRDTPILDYGCGVGTLTARLRDRFDQVHGFDPSQVSLSRARQSIPGATFFDDPAALPPDFYGVVVMSGVLHHIHPERRGEVLKAAVSKLRPGGQLVVFEHNPLNPLTRRVVAQCPFDDDAILLWPGEASRLLRDAGLSQVKRRFIVFFPRALASLRGLEPRLSALPIGAQMMLVGARPQVR